MNVDVYAVQQFDNELVMGIKQKQVEIDETVAKSPQTITEVRSHRVLMPWRGTKHGTTSATFVLVEFRTSAGLLGLDEVMGGALSTEGDVDDLRKRVVGKSSFDPAVRKDLGIAYWDLVGKVVEQPLHMYLADLFALDGKRRKRVPFAAYTWARYADLEGKGEVNFQNYPEFCQELVKEGHRTIKLSAVDYEPYSYIDLVHRIREAVGPKIGIRIDTHGSWGPSDALKVMRGIEDCNVEYMETPVGGPIEAQWRQMTHMRNLTSVPISAHSWLPPYIWRPGLHHGTATLDQELDLAALARYDAADISAPDFSYGVVSPLAAKRIYDVARHLGMGLMMHSAYELGVKVAMRMHIASFSMAYDFSPILDTWGAGPTPGSAYVLDGHYNQWVDDVLAGGKMPYEQGFLTISDKPGLGVDLDPDKLEEYRYTEEKAEKLAAHQEITLKRFRADTEWIRERNGWRKWQEEEVLE